jgi:hypothetical protein
MSCTTGVQFPAGVLMRISLFVTESRPALETTQSQMGAGVKAPGE